jgi:hypothetical protein
MEPLSLGRIMTLLRLIQRASILAGMIFAGLSLHSNLAHANDAQFCAITNSVKLV